MFRNIILVYKTNLKNHLFEKVEEIKQNFPESNFLAVEYSSVKKDMLEDADLVITFGGDGTFVKAANLIENSYILGINAEPDKSEGALTTLKINEIKKLKEIAKGNFKIQEMQRAKIILNEKVLDENAINEIYIGTVSQFHTSRYKLKFKEKQEEQRSSGVLVTTGAGSAAWFCSAGGKQFDCQDKKLKFLVREPYVGKRVFIPTLLEGEILPGEKLILESTRDLWGVVSINDSIYPFNTGDVVEIMLSEKPLKVIKE